MKLYSSNHYSSTIKLILKDFLALANKDPFKLNYLIVDDPKYYEEILLKETNVLFNIEILTLSSFYNLILQKYQKNFKKKTEIDNILEIMKLNKEDKSSLFNKSQNHVLCASEILEVFKNFYLYEIKDNNSELPSLSKNKVKTLFNLYNKFNKDSFFEHDYLYSLIDSNCNDNYCFISNQLYPKDLKIIDKLDNYGNVYLYKHAGCNEVADYTGYTTNHLFDSIQDKTSLANPYQILEASNIREEIKQVVYDIYKLLDNHSFSDFAIYYPNDDYYRHLSKILDSFKFAYNKKETVYNNIFLVISKLLEYLLTLDDNCLLDALSSYCFKDFSDKKYVSYLKNVYYSQGIINDERFVSFRDSILLINGNSVSELSLALISFIESNCNLDEDFYVFISLLPEGNDVVSIKEYLSLLELIYVSKDKMIKEKIDSIYLFNYSQAYSELLNIKYVYCLGLNETIIPQEFKNTKLLLNLEAQAINYPTTYDDLAKHQSNLLHIFSNHHQKITLSYALRDLNGEDLVVSSIISKLTKLYNIPKFTKHLLIHPALKEDYYLLNEVDDNLTSLNNKLLIYKETKNQVLPLKLDYQPNPLSASKLQVYNQCPYKYYLQYILKVNPLNDSYLQSNEIGTLVHYVLEKNNKYFNDNKAKDFSKLKEDIHNSIVNYLNDHKLVKYNLSINKFFIRLIEDDLYNTIIVLAKQMQSGLFSVSSCEERVYDKIQDIELKGFIDRVDLYDNYLKVIDYKSSNKELNLKLARLGFNIQMLLYLEMLSKNKGYDKGAVLYFNTKKRMLKSELSILDKHEPVDFLALYQMDGYCVDSCYESIDHDMELDSKIVKVKLKKDGSPNTYSKVISSDDLNVLLQDITNHIQELYQRMISGDIRIYPTRSENSAIDTQVNPCKFCSYKALCNYDIFYNEDNMIELGEKDEER